MKKRILNIISISSLLFLSGASLFSCNKEDDKQEKETRYFVTYNESEDYVINGIESEGYLNGDTLKFSVDVTNKDKKISEVTINNNIVSPNSNLEYEYIINNSDVRINITLVNKSIFEVSSPGNNKIYPTNLEKFTPTLFKEDSLSIIETNILGDGVSEDVYSFSLNNGNEVRAHTISVDLTKAKLTTNYASEGIATPYEQMLDYESKTNKKVMAITNADFFATGVGTSVNAYATNNKVIKASHNDNGIYDHLTQGNDVPASMPMLIGVSGESALISPLIQSDSKEEVIKSKLSNILVYEANNEVITIENVLTNGSSLTSNYDLLLINENIKIELSSEDVLYKVKLDDSSEVITSGLIEQIIDYGIDDFSYNITDASEYFYFVSSEDLSLEVNKRVGYSLTSEDDTFKFYKDIIGGRQSLVENGEIAKTVSEENSNGAQTSNIPRTSIGIKDDHTIILCAIEALRYGNHSSSDSDTYGVNLPELAEFLRYIGCFDAMNFDGGGSTQLITKNDNGNGLAKVRIRSSDYGTYELADSRKVYNTVIISTK